MIVCVIERFFESRTWVIVPVAVRGDMLLTMWFSLATLYVGVSPSMPTKQLGWPMACLV